MIRKLILVAAVAAMPLGMIAATGTVAGAVSPATGTATCKTITGTVKFSHVETKAGVLATTVPLKQTITVTAKLGGCTTVPAGKAATANVTGTIVTTTAVGKTAYKCTGLLGASLDTSAKLSVAWNTAISPTCLLYTSDAADE